MDGGHTGYVRSPDGLTPSSRNDRTGLHSREGRRRDPPPRSPRASKQGRPATRGRLASASGRSRGRDEGQKLARAGRKVAPCPVRDMEHGKGPGRVFFPQGGEEAGAPRPASASASCQIPSLWPTSRTVATSSAKGLQAGQQAAVRRQVEVVLQRQRRGRCAKLLDQGRQRLTGTCGRGTQDQVRAWAMLSQMIGNSLGGPLTAAIRGGVHGRSARQCSRLILHVAGGELSSRRAVPESASQNKCLGNCHDTVM